MTMTKSLVAYCASLIASLSLSAAPLTSPAAVHTQPDVNAPVITVLSPGANPLEDTAAVSPEGWIPVVNPGPFEGYVLNKDIDKGLHVKLGAEINMQPKTTAGVLTHMEDNDKASITGLHGKWTQIKLDKSITGYMRGQRAASSATIATPTLNDVATQQTPSPTAASSGNSDYNRPQAVTTPARNFQPAPSGSAALPRVFEGKFVTTRRPFAPRRPYDWQLNDSSGVRYAYLDITKLLLTDQIENYADHTVIVFGAPRALSDGRNIVIQVESLRLK